MIKKYSSLKKESIKGEITSPEFQYWFNGSILQKDGVPILLYHQTSKENEQKILEEGYDISKGQARLSDEVMPDGIFLKYDDSDIGIGHAEKEQRAQMAFYVKLTNPLVVDNRNELADFLNQDVEYRKAFDEIEWTDKEEKQKHDKLYKEMTKVERGKLKGSPIHDQVWEQLNAWDKKIKDLATEARNIGTEFLKSKGYDGIIMENDSGSFGRKVRTVVVFSPEQIRTAKPDTELPKKK
jgi:hypothetical protein